MTGILRDITIGPCRLILGDMRAVIPQLDLDAALALSDPPYRLTPGGNTSGAMGGCFAPGAYDNSGELFAMVEWSDMAPLFHRVLHRDADAIIMTSDREEAAARAAFLAADFRFHRLLVWDKITATPNRWYMPNCEFALYLYKGRARVITDCASKALIRCPQRDEAQDFLPLGEAGHATEKPVALMTHWIGNSTDPGDLVIDPFMGTGTTLVAALRSGRRAVGIELDPKWFDVACARVRAALDRGPDRLFENAPQSGSQGALCI